MEKIATIAYLNDNPMAWIVKEGEVEFVIQLKEGIKMIQLSDESMGAINRLLETSQCLHTALVRSPMWEFVKTEPVILQWINALSQTESVLKPKPPNEEGRLYGTKA